MKKLIPPASLDKYRNLLMTDDSHDFELALEETIGIDSYLALMYGCIQEIANIRKRMKTGKGKITHLNKIIRELNLIRDSAKSTHITINWIRKCGLANHATLDNAWLDKQPKSHG